MALPGTTTGAITTEDIFKGRFKSGIVGQVETLVNCLIYIYLNPLRAGLLEGLKDTAGIRSDIILKLETWIRSSNLLSTNFFQKKGRTHQIVVRLFSHVLRYLDISQSETMNLIAILFTSNFHLQNFTISCQYLECVIITDS